MIERKFIAKGIRNAEIEEYLEHELVNADYSHSEIKRTPLSTRIVVYAGRPGMVIGRSGSKIKEVTDTLATRFAISNPQIEVKGVENPYIDAAVMAKQIAYALEKGTNYRRAVNIFLENIMGAGAIGVEICLAGKLSGARKRKEKFIRGHLKKAGDSRETCTQIGKATAGLKPGMIGIKVRIMHSFPDVLLIEKRMQALKEGLKAKAEEKQAGEKPAAGEPAEVKEEKKSEEAPKPEAGAAEEKPSEEKKEEGEAKMKSPTGSAISSHGSEKPKKESKKKVASEKAEEQAPAKAEAKSE